MMEPRVTVITGASSGLGRALALELAQRGDALALAARRVEELERVAAECRAAGAEALVVATDVTREADVDRLAQATLARWGRIDAWVNNAGVTLYGLLEQGPFEAHQRVLETNLFGAIYGARAVVPIFRRQHRGVLINIGSVLSEIGQAFVPSYAISKFGVRGLSEALRVELADQADIHVCTVFPYAMDTPHFQVAENLMGQTPYALPPVQEPEAVARAIAAVIEHPRRVRHVPRVTVLGLALHALAPRFVERLLLATLRRWHLVPRPPPPDSNLRGPPRQRGAIHGTRRPLLSAARLFVWQAGQVLSLVFESALRSRQRLAARTGT